MTRRGRVRLNSVFALALLGATTGLPLAAQEALQDFDETGNRGFELLGAVGLLTPVGNLTEDPASFGTTINVNVAYGLEGTIWLSRHWGVGAAGWYSPAQLQARDLPQGIEGPDLGSADYATGAIEAIYRFRGEGSRSVLEPYLAAGGGIRHLSVGPEAAPEVRDATDPAAVVAGGVRLEGVLTKMMIRLEVRDHISMFESPTTGESKLQNDIILSFGVGVRF